MAVPKQYAKDVQAIIERRHQHGSDFWATADGRWGKGSPFSTFDCALMLTELGMRRADPMMKGIADTFFAAWQDDGRFRPAPKGTVYPRTSSAARPTSTVFSWATRWPSRRTRRQGAPRRRRRRPCRSPA